MKPFLAILALISTLSAMEIENDGVNAADTTYSKPGSQTVLHLQVFEEVLAVLERRRDFNQALYTRIQDTNIPIKERVAEFEKQSGRRSSSNKLIGRFKDYTNKIARDLERYNDLIPEVRGIISSTNTQEREDAANRLYAYLQWTRKAADTVLVENANKDFHEIEFYVEMIGQLERFPITDAYKNFHHYITVRTNNTNSDGIGSPEYTASIIASVRKIAQIHGPFNKAVHVLLREMQDLETRENFLQFLNHRSYICAVQDAEVAYDALKTRYDQIHVNLRALTALAAFSSPFYSSKKEVLGNVPSIMREIQALEEMSKEYQSFEERFQSLLDHQMAQNVLNRLEAEEGMKKVQLTQAKNDRAEQIKERIRKKVEETRRAQQTFATESVMLKPAATDEKPEEVSEPTSKKAKQRTKPQKRKK